jgi:hypothetical protein
VLPATTKRDALLATIAGLLILGFIVFGVVEMSRPVAGNKLTGVILEKSFAPQKERQVDFTGGRIDRTREIDGEYVLKVRVEKENRVYDVPVEKALYESRKVGDSITFMRPESEHR